MTNLRVLVYGLALITAAPVCCQGQSLSPPETVVVQSGALKLHGLLWWPAGGGPFPAVLFNHGSGSNPEPRLPGALGPVFARHGYAFLWLFRRGAGLSSDQGADSGTLMARALAEKGQEGRNEVQLQLQEIELRDVMAGLAFLRAHPGVDGGRVAIAGHSFGGQLTLLAAEQDTGLRAAVTFGAAAGSWDKSPELRERLLVAVRKIQIPIFLTHAANDFSLAFYDLDADPDQRVNRIDAPRYRKVVGKVKELLLAYREEGSDPQLDNFKTLLTGGTPVVKQPPQRADGPE